jgi:hypothetical protein
MSTASRAAPKRAPFEGFHEDDDFRTVLGSFLSRVPHLEPDRREANPTQFAHYISHTLGKGPAESVQEVKPERGSELVNPVFSACTQLA